MLKIEQISSSSVLILWKSNIDGFEVVAFQAKYKRVQENPVWQEGDLLTSLNSTLVLRNLTVGASYFVQIVVFLSSGINMESKKSLFEVKSHSQVLSSSDWKHEAATLAGSIIAGLMLLVLVVAVSFCCIQKMRKRNTNTPQQTYPPTLDHLIENRRQPTATHLAHNDKLLVELQAISKKCPML